MLVTVQQHAALRALPALLFLFYKRLYPVFLYIQKVFDLTHAVLGPVPFIQTFQPGAWK
jgi:hypothetical protein